MRPTIVILSAFATPLRSGAEACAEEVPVCLKDRYDFVIVTARMRRDLPRHDQLNGIPVERVGFGCTCDKWLYPFLAPLAARKYKPQIIHAILETFAGLALHICRYVVPSAGRLLTLQTTNRNFLKQAIIRSADRVTAISSVLLETAKKCGRSDVTLIPNGVDVSSVAAAVAGNPRIPGRVLFVGRLERMKGVDTLLVALAQVALPDGPAPWWELRIVGDGSEKAALEWHASQVFAPGRVRFLGYIPAPALYAEYAQAEIFCALSRSEALGNVFIEAQAAGCAVVATAVGGIPDVVRADESGLLVPPDDPNAAAAALRRLLCDEALRKTLAENGRGNAAQYSWPLIAARYDRVYGALLTR